MIEDLEKIGIRENPKKMKEEKEIVKKQINEPYWYEKYQLLEKEFSELRSQMEIEIRQRDAKIESLEDQKRTDIQQWEEEIDELQEKLGEVKDLSRFNDYLKEYTDLLRKSWVISVGGYKAGQVQREIQVARITLGKDEVTLVDTPPNKDDFRTLDNYFSAVKEYFEALIDVNDTRKKLIEYQLKYPALSALVQNVKESKGEGLTAK